MLFFFFSSRSRHTRSYGDWSSDVCSSDLGGPIGCEWAIENRERVLSLTALNTMLDPASFRRPWTMAPFALRGVGELWLSGTPRTLFRALFYSQGIANRR